MIYKCHECTNSNSCIRGIYIYVVIQEKGGIFGMKIKILTKCGESFK